MPPDQSVRPLDVDFPLARDHPFTTAQAADAGISRKVLGRLTREGRLRRMVKGVYVASHVVDSLALRTESLALVVPEHAVVTDWTATWLYTGLLAPGGHLEVPPVSVFLPPGRGRLRNGLCTSGERAFTRDDVTVAGGLHATTPLRTAWDIGRLSPRDHAICGLDGLLALGVFNRAELCDVERFRKQRGVVQLRGLVPLADARSQSPGESVLRLRWLDLSDLPHPEPQVPILGDGGRPVFWLDLGVRDLRFAVEYDGEAFHSSEADTRHDERRREWIRRNRGWLIVPVRRANLHGPTRDIERILYAGVELARRQLDRSRSAA